MAVSLSDDLVRFLRLRAQRLALPPSERIASVAHVVKELCGIQAQEAPAAALAVRGRSVGLVAANVEHARVQERSVVRTWGPRGTLHLLAAEDLNWLLPLLGPVFIAAGRRRRAELGLDEDTCAKGIRIIRDVLAHRGSLTRAELVEQLAIQGMRIEGQEHREHPLPEVAAYAKLTRRYLKAYGPATPEDQATWSGMPMSKTRAAWQNIADQLIEVEIAGRPAWMLKTCAAWLDEPPAHAPIVRLLPRFDTYLLGYQNRDLAVPLQYAKRINAGGGILHPTLLVDGRAAGTWKSKPQKNHLDVIVEPFDYLAPKVLGGLEAEVADLARFLEVNTKLCN